MTVTPVVEPESLGIDTQRLEELRTRVRREIDDGLLPSCQFALARDGRLAAFETVGAAGPKTRYVIFSATKAFVASAAWLLIGDGSLDVDRRVADYIPEFATNGKDVVTVEQVMLHTSGFRRGPTVIAASTRSPAGGSTGSPAPPTSTTRPRLTGCSPSSSSASPVATTA